MSRPRAGEALAACRFPCRKSQSGFKHGANGIQRRSDGLRAARRELRRYLNSSSALRQVWITPQVRGTPTKIHANANFHPLPAAASPYRSLMLFSCAPPSDRHLFGFFERHVVTLVHRLDEVVADEAD